ncbi:hypothetical protein GEMRC1_000731 [Eukaryota sp. GEM-RC1]
MGYVSRRFFESCFSAVKVFLESNNVIVHAKDLPQLSSISGFFDTEVRSIWLDLDRFIEAEDFLNYTAIVTGLSDYNIDACSSFPLTELLESSSPLFLPHLKVLCIHMCNLDNVFECFCNSLMVNSTVVELKLFISSLTKSKAASLAAMFSSTRL